MKSHPQARREFYLNDPLLLKKAQPLRTPAGGSNGCGVSSIQVFDGEDVQKYDRLARQRQELVDAVEHDLAQKKQQRDLAEQRAQQEAQYLQQLDLKLNHLEQRKQEIHKSLDHAQAHFNNQIARNGKPKLVVDKFLPNEDFFGQFNTSAR